jgi:NAD(P)-dependent dehydrogenase (short-subunit alcohol dehydrogenase family)
MKLVHRVAVVTGAGGALGQAISAAFAREGACLVVVDINGAGLEAIRGVCSELGTECITAQADVSDPASALSFSREALQRFGRIDVLVNAAGIYGPIGNLVDVDMTEWQRTVQTNLLATVYACHAVLPTMIERGRGSIINLSGGGATAPLPRFSAYGASKAAVVRFTETLAAEVVDHGVRVNAIAPGLIDTGFHDAVLQVGESSGGFRETIRQLRETGAGGTPIHVPAQLAVFLASDMSDGLTGRLLSAPNDDWANWKRSDIEMLDNTPWYTLRRIDHHTLSAIDRSPRPRPSTLQS